MESGIAQSGVCLGQLTITSSHLCHVSHHCQMQLLNISYCTLCPKKTTLMLHTIDSTHINRFRQFLAEMLLREYAIEW